MLYEIIFLGRGGQGAVTASNILVQAAIYENKQGQSFPFFGAERRGAPVTAYARISDRPILKHGMFSDTDVLVILDDSLLKLGIARRFKVRNRGVLIVNTDKKFPRDQVSVDEGVKAYIVNAIQIARDLGLIVAGWPLVNTAMLGALSSATKIVSIDNVEKAIVDYLGEKIGLRNAEAARRAYREVIYMGDL